MNLAEMSETDRCRVRAASEGNNELQSRLYALGLYPGVEVEVMRFAPTGDPIQIRVGGTTLSIRKQEARSITVEVIA